MNERRADGAIDWDRIDLIVFDVDGTLYRQSALRARMVKEMLLHVVRQRNVDVPSIVGTYRRVRDSMGADEVEGFEVRLVAETSRRTGRSRARVQSIVSEWIERRPLPYLAAVRYPGVLELFAAIKRIGTAIGIFSDYAAHAKLAALGLEADFVRSASDEEVGVLKPNPKGLECLMREAGVTPARTIMIGDRPERDGLAARRAGARCLIRSSRACAGWRTFTSYRSPVFAPLFHA